MKTFLLIPILLILGNGSLRADSTFLYRLDAGKATITGFTASAATSGALTIPASVDGYAVVSVSRGAFRNCTGITSLTFASGSSVASIDVQAFQNCTALVSASLPASVTILRDGAFLDCESLTSVSLSSGLTTIGAACFAGCDSLTALTLPSGVVSIGESAFQDCSSLATINVPSGVTKLSAHVFDGCGALASLSLPSGLLKIGDHALADADSLSTLTIPDSVTEIGTGAFSGCDTLASLTLGASLAELGEDFDLACDALAVISVHSGNPVFASVSGMLLNASKTILLRVPSAYGGNCAIPSTVTTIAEGALAHCHALTSVSLPPNLSEIPRGAFYYADSLNAIELPASLRAIGEWAFGGCRGLTAITLPDGLEEISDNAFCCAASLEDVVFEGNAPTLGDGVFDYTASALSLFVYSGSSGFAVSPWTSYAVVIIGADAMPELDWADIDNPVEGWNVSSWYGSLYAESDWTGWIYHSAHGWEYIFDLGGTNGVALFDCGTAAWWFTSAAYYPFLFNYTNETWYFFIDGVSPARRYYDYGTRSVVTESAADF